MNYHDEYVKKRKEREAKEREERENYDPHRTHPADTVFNPNGEWVGSWINDMPHVNPLWWWDS